MNRFRRARIIRRVITLLGVISALIAIFVFATGKFTYSEATTAVHDWWGRLTDRGPHRSSTAAAAQVSTLRRIQAQIEMGVTGYNETIAAVMAGRAPVEQALEKVRLLERDLMYETAEDGLSSLDRMSPTDRVQFAQRVPGMRLWYHESVGVEIDSAFFFDLSKKYGDEADREFFTNYRLTFPEGYRWPDYVEGQTDVTGCVRFGSGALVEAYERWSRFRSRHPAQYIKESRGLYDDVASDLTSATCACGDAEAVIKELSEFAARFPNSPITPRVTERLNAVVDGQSDFRFRCISG